MIQNLIPIWKTELESKFPAGEGEKYAGKFPLLLPSINQNLCLVIQELCKSFLLLLVSNLLAATPRKREWVSNPNLCLCKFLSLFTFATLSFINSNHTLFLSGKGMFFGTDQPWVKFYSSLINFSIAGFIMKLHKVLWPSLLVGTPGTAERGPCYELTKGARNFSPLLLPALLIAFTILQSKVHEFGYRGLFFGLFCAPFDYWDPLQ